MTTLGSTIGGLSLPLDPPAQGEVIGEKALVIFGLYLQAFLRAYAGTAWATVAPSEPIVRKVFTHDPEDYDFSENDLPALYLFRTGSAKPIEQMAEDWRVHHDNVRIFWVLPNVAQDRQRLRSPILPYVGKLFDAAFDRERDPVFVLDSDPDPTKFEQGSMVTRAAGVEWAIGDTWKKLRLGIAMRAGEGERRLYDAVDFKLELAERVIQGFDDLTSIPQLDLMVGITDEVNPLLPFSEFEDIGPFSSGFGIGFSGSIVQGGFSTGFASGFE